MLHFLYNYRDPLKFVVTLIAIGSALYRYFAPPDVQRANHLALTEFVAKAARYDWLERLQQGVRLVLNAMTFIYGPPNESVVDGPKRYLTLRAWRMSAWIASLYIFVVFPFGLAAIPHYTGQPSDLKPRIFLILLASALLAAHIFALRFLRSPRQKKDFKALYIEFFRGIALVSTLGLAYIVLVVVDKFYFKSVGHISEVRFFTNWAILITISALLLLRTLAKFGFYAPLVITAAAIIALLIFGFFFMSASCLFVLAGFGKPSDEAFWSAPMSILALATCAMILPFLFAIFMKREIARLAPLVLLAASFPGLAFGIISGTVHGANGPVSIGLTLFVLLPMFVAVNVAPYVTMFYGTIFSNSVPDWLSVGLSRYLLSRAASSSDLKGFARWFGTAIGAAFGFVLLSFLITSLAMTIAYLLMRGPEFLQAYANHASVTKDNEIEAFLHAGAMPFVVLFEFAAHGRHAAGSTYAKFFFGPTGNGFFYPFATALFGSPYVLPALSTSGILVALTVGRKSTLVFGAGLRRLHSFLMLKPDASAEQAQHSISRGSGLLVVSGVAVFLLALWTFDEIVEFIQHFF